MFLRNVWYAAWWSDELDDEALHARTIADTPIVFWRDETGAPHALLDRCPHRYAPLSLGKRFEGGVQCGYHGIAFDGEGRCLSNPHGPRVAALCVRAFPSVERHGLIWAWMGDAEQADEALIPDLGFADRAPATAFSRGFLPTAAGHQLIADNILDLTHADYLHAANLGGGALTRSKPRIEERAGPSLFVEWPAFDDVPPPFFAAELPEPGGRVDLWNSVSWYPNGTMALRFGATPAGQPREAGIDTWAAHIVTPETARTTHYFYMNTRDFRTGDQAYNKAYAEAMKYAFSVEDKPMLEGQQRRLGDADLFDRDPVLLPTDAASTRARRLYARLVEAETGAPARLLETVAA